jgi:hypothetical protein
VDRALSALHAAALTVASHGSDAALTAATAALNRDLASVQHDYQQALAAGRAGNCAASFDASRGAHAAHLLVRDDVAALGRVITQVRAARAHYDVARRGALRALQALYNAIAGHPLQAAPSQIVAALQTTMSSDDRITSAMTARAGTVLSTAQSANAQARVAEVDAAQAACYDVSA